MSDPVRIRVVLINGATDDLLDSLIVAPGTDESAAVIANSIREVLEHKFDTED